MGSGPSSNTNQVQTTDQKFSDVSNMAQQMASAGTTNNAQTQSVSGTTQQNPWAPAVPDLSNILSSIGGIPMNLTPAQQAALTATSTAAGSMPNFGNPATNAVSNMFSSMNGVPEAGLWGNAYGNYANTLSPFQSLSNLNPMNTPGFSEALFDPVSGINAAIANNTKALFAGAGRDPAGNADASKAIALGESQADLPALMAQYNTNVGDYLGAAASQFGAAGNTATGMTNLMQTPITNSIAGINNAGNVGQLWMQPSMAQLGAANTGYGLPFSNIALPEGMTTQLAGLGNTTSQAGTTDTSGQQTQQKTATGTSGGTQSGTQQGTSTGNSTTTSSQNPFATAAGIGLGLFSMFG